MKAAVLHTLRAPLTVEDVPMPECGPDDLLVRTMACGICGTDIHIQDGWGYTPRLPFIMGHEPAGVVVSVGKNVDRFQVGDRVVPNIFFSCGLCYYCRVNRETQCLQLGGILGVLTHAGAYAEYFRVPARQVFPLPPEISFPDGAIIADAVVTAVHAVDRGRVAAGETVLIIGAGGCGGAAIQVCTMRGARVIAIDVGLKKQAHALSLGAAACGDSLDPNLVEMLHGMTGGMGAQCVIDTVGQAETLSLATRALARGGRVTILGYTQERFPLDPRQIAVNELEIIGTRSGGRQCTADAIQIVADPRWKSLVTDTFDLTRVNDALACVRNGAALGRVVLTYAQ
jgi:D-arabinose 1-dehydrogenase-like Zn-dependent alcohol dehydrogenase